MKVFLIHNWTLGAMEQFIFNLSTLKFSNTAARRKFCRAEKDIFTFGGWWCGVAWRGQSNKYAQTCKESVLNVKLKSSAI